MSPLQSDVHGLVWLFVRLREASKKAVSGSNQLSTLVMAWCKSFGVGCLFAEKTWPKPVFFCRYVQRMLGSNHGRKHLECLFLRFKKFLKTDNSCLVEIAQKASCFRWAGCPSCVFRRLDSAAMGEAMFGAASLPPLVWSWILLEDFLRLERFLRLSELIGVLFSLIILMEVSDDMKRLTDPPAKDTWHKHVCDRLPESWLWVSFWLSV